MEGNLMKKILFGLYVTVVFLSCTTSPEDMRLPILGRIQVDEVSGDTTFHTIADFELTDQDSMKVTNGTFSNSIYIADFFFTTCPDICPAMKTQMLRIYEAYGDRDDVKFLSHTIDPNHDTVPVLKDFSDRLGVNNSTWRFVTADMDYMYKLGQTSYMASMSQDSQTGFTHSGRFFLVDKQRRIRGAYDGTDEISVNFLIADIKKLLKEYE